MIIANHWLHGNKPAAVLVHGVNEGADSCNVIGISVKAPSSQPQSFNAKDTEVILKKDGARP